MSYQPGEKEKLADVFGVRLVVFQAAREAARSYQELASCGIVAMRLLAGKGLARNLLQQSFASQHGKCLTHRCTRHAQHFRQRRLSQPLSRRERATQNHFPDTNQRAGLLSIHAQREAQTCGALFLTGSRLSIIVAPD